jgi:hypothetical protein
MHDTWIGGRLNTPGKRSNHMAKRFSRCIGIIANERIDNNAAWRIKLI